MIIDAPGKPFRSKRKEEEIDENNPKVREWKNLDVEIPTGNTGFRPE